MELSLRGFLTRLLGIREAVVEEVSIEQEADERSVIVRIRQRVWCTRSAVSELTHRERCAGSGVGIGDPDSRPPVGRNADFGQSGRTSCRIELNVDDATRPQLGTTRLARSS
jgi:hypothetical protein